MLENFFSKIRQKGGSNPNPTCTQFRAAFRQVCINGFIESAANGNCSVSSYEQCLVNISDLRTMTDPPKSNLRVERVVVDPFELQDANNNDKGRIKFCSGELTELPSENAFFYVCGYFLKKLLAVHFNCEKCITLKCDDVVPGEMKAIFATFKSFTDKKMPLVIPCDSFFAFMHGCDNIFVSVFNNSYNEMNVCENIVNTIIVNVTLPAECCQDAVVFGDFIRTFVRIRVYFALKFYNSEMQSAALKGAKKNVMRKRNTLYLKVKHL